VAVDCAVLFGGHWWLRRSGVATRVAYGAMGGAAAAFGYAFALSRGLMFVLPPAGTQLTGAILPILIGVIAGTLFQQLAGREIIATSADAGPEQAIAASEAPQSLPPRYDGPVQVRTSGGAMLVASVIPACILFLFSSLFMIESAGVRPNWILRIASSGSSYVSVVALIMTLLPSAIVVGATHAIARALGQTRALDYVIVGGAAGFVVACALYIHVPPMLLYPFAIGSGVLMGAAYRRFAGLEPLPLPEAVLAADPETLVPVDHPSRRGHAVITNP
jgi:hypothetical protein